MNVHMAFLPAGFAWIHHGIQDRHAFDLLLRAFESWTMTLVALRWATGSRRKNKHMLTLKTCTHSRAPSMKYPILLPLEITAGDHNKAQISHRRFFFSTFLSYPKGDKVLARLTNQEYGVWCNMTSICVQSGKWITGWGWCVAPHKILHGGSVCGEGGNYFQYHNIALKKDMFVCSCYAFRIWI